MLLPIQSHLVLFQVRVDGQHTFIHLISSIVRLLEILVLSNLNPMSRMIEFITNIVCGCLTRP